MITVTCQYCNAQASISSHTDRAIERMCNGCYAAYIDRDRQERRDQTPYPKNSSSQDAPESTIDTSTDPLIA